MKNFAAQNICPGADPFVWRQHGLFHLLLQGDIDSNPLAHDGLRGYTIRSAPTIAELHLAEPKNLLVPDTGQPHLHQLWAGEVLGDAHLYVGASDGDNVTHRIHIYRSEGDLLGPWSHMGQLNAPDDYWAIDFTHVVIDTDGSEKKYAVWSGWEKTVAPGINQDIDIVPQHLYIAEVISAYEIGPRHLIASPTGSWCSNASVAILEGPQALILDGVFQGLLVTGNASWAVDYATRVLRYVGGNPLHESSWRMGTQPFLPEGQGIGHGVLVAGETGLWFVGHRKTVQQHGWRDRTVFYCDIQPDELRAHIEAI